jgi:hypothetical protein
MQKTREQSRHAAAIAPAADAVAVAASPAQVRLIAGADVQDLELGGRTVAEARQVVQALFGIHPAAQALLDGEVVGEDQVITNGQLLEFVKHAGQKGAALRRADAIIEVRGEQVTWRRNGRAGGAISVSELMGRAGQAGVPPQCWRLYPHQVRLMAERRGGEVVGVIIEMPAGPRHVRWITDDSPDPFGGNAKFIARYLSFPWIVLLVVFSHGDLSNVQQAFYRNAPIRSLDDELYCTNLLNVAKGYQQDDWVCLARLHGQLGELGWPARIRAVTDHFWSAAFNRSSEVHEGNSRWGSAKPVDPRLANAAEWEAATRVDPYFTLQVPWRRARQSVGATLEAMLELIAPYRPVASAEQLVTLMQQDEDE